MHMKNLATVALVLFAGCSTPATPPPHLMPREGNIIIRVPAAADMDRGPLGHESIRALGAEADVIIAGSTRELTELQRIAMVAGLVYELDVWDLFFPPGAIWVKNLPFVFSLTIGENEVDNYADAFFFLVAAREGEVMVAHLPKDHPAGPAQGLGRVPARWPFPLGPKGGDVPASWKRTLGQFGIGETAAEKWLGENDWWIDADPDSLEKYGVER